MNQDAPSSINLKVLSYYCRLKKSCHHLYNLNLPDAPHESSSNEQEVARPGLRQRMLHEVLLALVGHSGSIIQEQPIYETKSRSRNDKPATTFRVPDSITFLASTERVAINRVVGLGVTYRELRQFVRPRPQPWRPHGPSVGNSRIESSALGDSSLYIRAFKIGVEELLDEYSKRVAEVERDVMADPTLTIARIDAGIREVSFEA